MVEARLRRLESCEVFCAPLKPHHQRRHEGSYKGGRTPPEPRTQLPRQTGPKRKASRRPKRKNIGIKTMQMQKTGHERRQCDLACARSMIAGSNSSPAWLYGARCSRLSTVASSTRIPTASARPPSVMRLMVSPNALKSGEGSKAPRSGIDTGNNQRASP